MKNKITIKKQLAQPQVIEYIKQVLSVNQGMCRSDLGKDLCTKLDFYDRRDQPQLSTCLKALRDLEHEGFFSLPAPLKRKRKGSPRRLEQPVAEPCNVPSRVDSMTHLELIKVKTEDQMRLWNELIVVEHPQGHRPLVGRQLRYLIRSESGWLGALGFAAPALKLGDRDQWIGWSPSTRQRYLDRIVCLSRFLIRQSVHCVNLASTVLGMCLRVLPADFSQVYGYHPWLVETFVDTTRFRGTCYRASNWIRIGQTLGRGRQDRHREYAEPIKEIYVYPLAKDFRQKMGLAEDAGEDKLRLDHGLTSQTWAEKEFAATPLGDRRLTKRVIEIARIKSNHPGLSWTAAIKGDKTATNGYYRFIASPDDSAVTMKTLLHTHRQRTIRRMMAQPRVLCIQDSSDLNYSSLVDCRDLGIIGKNQTKSKSRGLRLHSTYVTTEKGLPLGVLKADCFAPQLKPEHKNRDKRYIPIEEKETVRWIKNLEDCQSVTSRIPGTRIISVNDREADFFEFFDQWRCNPCVDLLVRAKSNRRTTENKKLFELVQAEPIKMRVKVTIPRRSSKPKKGRRGVRRHRPSRTTTVVLRYRHVKICPPHCGINRKKEPIELRIIYVTEPNPPPNCEDPIQWFLLTTLPLDSPEKALQCLKYYCLRWRIEDFHRVLKSGCKIEDLAHKTAERLRRVIAINLVIAYRIMLLTLLGREQPDLPPEVFFTRLEIKVLRLITKKKQKN